MNSKPNVLLILCDDMGYSDVGCYGGEIDTPNIDNLASTGVKFTQFYNTARCSPSRASLLTGLHPHQTGIGILVDDDSPEGYAGTLNKSCVTIAEVLGENGYETYMSGKWHVVNELKNPNEAWPLQRGFNHFYGTITGAGNYFHPKTLVRGNENIEDEAKDDPDYYYTDKVSDTAVNYLNEHQSQRNEKPFFLYIAYTAPHWPLHAKPEDIEKYKGRFDEGWDILREKRLKNMVKLDLLKEDEVLSPRDYDEKAWKNIKNKSWETQRMETYAAQINCMDLGIGRILDTLKKNNQYENTIIIFLSDNGGCAENLPLYMGLGVRIGYLPYARLHTKNGKKIKYGNWSNITPGSEETFMSYGRAWANLSNTPFRLYKHWAHEGGIATPFIISWKNGIENSGDIIRESAQLPDVLATILDILEIEYPEEYQGHKILPLEGRSLVPALSGGDLGKRCLFFEHEGNAAVRYGNWKLVRDFPGDWELYNVAEDRTELHNIVHERSELAQSLMKAYDKWAERVGVVPREKYFTIRYGKLLGPLFFKIYRAKRIRKITRKNERFGQYWASNQTQKRS